MFAKTQKYFLHFLLKAVPNQVKALLTRLTREQKLALREVAVNLLKGTFQVTKLQLRKMRKHKKFYRQLAKGETVKLLQKPIILMIEAAWGALETL